MTEQRCGGCRSEVDGWQEEREEGGNFPAKSKPTKRVQMDVKLEEQEFRSETRSNSNHRNNEYKQE
jgi:hypothetical protein